MPRKLVTRRAPSLLTRHKDWEFKIPGDTLPRSPCPGQLAMYFTPSAVRAFEAMIVIRCEGCGRPIEARGVVTLGWYSEPWVDADPDDQVDSEPWGV